VMTANRRVSARKSRIGKPLE